MKKLLLNTLSAALIAGAAHAATLTTDTVLGKSVEEITATLADMGYTVRKSEMEGGFIEVYFVGNDQKGEAYVDASTGMIRKLKLK